MSNSDEYPCISNNVTIFNQDSTVTGSYIGKDSCYVTPLHGFVNGAATIGIPGQQAISGAWHQNGNVVYFASGYSIISNINGKLLLTRKDSIFYGSEWGMITTVNIKQ
ncbi:MAG: hypothetical protein JWP45_2502 [Mucilaginibacter sp.]|nr:hypothetical protein [Mucilaginibacter sp.]